MDDISTATDTLQAIEKRKEALAAEKASEEGYTGNSPELRYMGESAHQNETLAAKFKCPNCNAEITFKPETQDFACDYCESRFTAKEMEEAIKAAREREKDAKEQEAIHDFESHTNIYRCGTCGAEIMADDRATATFCYYCHEPVILAGRLTGEYKPNKIIAFKLTRNQAEEKFLSWCKKRWFLPKSFSSDAQLEKMTGLYVPFWVADCDMTAVFEATGKKVRHWVSGNYQYTETKEYHIIRNAKICTDGIPADGESKIDDLLMESIEPFDYRDLMDFSMSYFSGFYADKYDVDKKAIFPRIKGRATNAAKQIIKSSISGYSAVHPTSERYNIINTNWQYMMLPVWFMTYKYNDSVYSFAINGQTGKLAGTPPLDKGRLVRFCIGLAAAAALAVGLFGGLLL